MKPMTLSRPLTWAPGAVISASAAHGSASLSWPLTASMCLRITSLALGICSPIVVGKAILSEVGLSPRQLVGASQVLALVTQDLAGLAGLA
jgi:hypothetical protein